MKRPIRQFCSFGFLALLSLVAQAQDDPRQWLEKMNRAVATLNYKGVYLHMHNAKVEAMQIIHRSHEGDVTERLIRLDGPRREIIRTKDEVTCVLPDKRHVIVERRKGKGALFSIHPVYSEGIDQYYEFRLLDEGKIIGYPTKVIVVRPKDEYRYGYRLWLDKETAMPLKSQLRDGAGNLLEQILFAQIEMPERIAEEEVRPVIPEEFKWFRADPRDQAREGKRASEWRASRIPTGFALSDSKLTVMAGSQTPVEHLVYSDGLASVSVFVEMADIRKDLKKGMRRVGSSHAFSTVVEGHHVTAVGEVPSVTVKLIGRSVSPKTLDARR